jgi:hypothetical protein
MGFSIPLPAEAVQLSKVGSQGWWLSAKERRSIWNPRWAAGKVVAGLLACTAKSKRHGSKINK